MKRHIKCLLLFGLQLAIAALVGLSIAFAFVMLLPEEGEIESQGRLREAVRLRDLGIPADKAWEGSPR